MAPGQALVGEQTELLAHHHPDGNEMEAYEVLLGDAMAGDQPNSRVRTTSKKPGASSTPS